MYSSSSISCLRDGKCFSNENSTQSFTLIYLRNIKMNYNSSSLYDTGIFSLGIYANKS